MALNPSRNHPIPMSATCGPVFLHSTPTCVKLTMTSLAIHHSCHRSLQLSIAIPIHPGRPIAPSPLSSLSEWCDYKTYETNSMTDGALFVLDLLPWTARRFISRRFVVSMFPSSVSILPDSIETWFSVSAVCCQDLQLREMGSFTQKFTGSWQGKAGESETVASSERRHRSIIQLLSSWIH